MILKTVFAWHKACFLDLITAKLRSVCFQCLSKLQKQSLNSDQKLRKAKKSISYVTVIHIPPY